MRKTATGQLTLRQRDVLVKLVEGKSNKTIGKELHMAEPTVKNHVTRILKSLNVNSRVEAIIKVTDAVVASDRMASSYQYRYTVTYCMYQRNIKS
jgi:DNA-binding NarL/FixJ family response regulator